MCPVICMITASACVDNGEDQTLVKRVRTAARAGAHLIQIRQPQLEGRALRRLVESSILAVNGTAARVLVNDRVDIALAAGAHGVHLRGDSMPAARVRAIAPRGFLIGRSVHSLGESVRLASDGNLDYLLFGSVFATRSKPGVDVAGIDALSAVCASVTLPVLAVGGMAPSCLGAVARAGAAGYAAIGLFANGPMEEMSSVVQQASSVFDTFGHVS